MSIREIKYFRPDGKDIEPTGVCYYKGGMYKEIEENTNSFIHQPLTESFLNEKVLPPEKQYGFAKYKGGMIVFALTVNATIDNIVKAWNAEFGNEDDMFLGAMTVGNNFKGKYQSGNQIYNDKSTSLELGGVPSKLLLMFATLLCKEFKQESVLVKDFNTGKIFLVDDEGVEGNTPKDKISAAKIELQKTNDLNSEVKND